jgi:hypothetical protein
MMEIQRKCNRRFASLYKETNFAATPMQVEYGPAEDTMAEPPGFNTKHGGIHKAEDVREIERWPPLWRG